MNPSLILALCLGYAAGDIMLAECNYDLQSGSSGMVRKAYAWWMTHSYPEHYALIAGIFTFPVSILVTYSLIDSACLQYRNGSVKNGPFPGSWVSDFCDFDIEPTQKKALQISLAIFYAWLVLIGGMCLLSGSSKRVYQFMHARFSLIGVSNGETILFVGVASLLIFNCVYWYHTFKYMLDNSSLYAKWMSTNVRRPTYFATQVTGRLLDVSLGQYTVLTQDLFPVYLCICHLIDDYLNILTGEQMLPVSTEVMTGISAVFKTSYLFYSSQSNT
jgi:hypothetical protein